MKKQFGTRLIAGIAAGATLLTLSACSAGGQDSADGTTTITVSDLPGSDAPEARKIFLDRVAAFEKQHPDITVEPSETIWAADTFQAMLAGGTMPTVMGVPFTEMSGLIERGQVADISDAIDQDSVLGGLNENVQAVAQNAEGQTFGVPVAAYSMSLLYNRELFTAAGLDPDDPPTTWDEVREAAKTIEDKTDAQGFQTMTKDSTGGWILTTQSYSRGSELQALDGDTVTATVDNDATKQALEFYRTLRWDDDTLGSNFLLNWGDVNNAFAAGTVGMYVQGADVWDEVVTNLGMSADAVGIAPLPQSPDGLGTLGGGTVRVINPKATPEQVAAGLDWVEFLDFSKYTDETVAVDDAKATVADGASVGMPVVPVVDTDTYDQYLSWVDAEINVPREHFTAYIDSTTTLPIVPEPSVKAQELYAILDSVVQAVLTQEDASIDDLLAQAQKSAEALTAP
ncbi:extracellular solute-binding protein [Herbiconiux sp. VKM Ac-1786]|uniref:ABC transporter substrate-binding protein n=1 Tax=Herbiconiux sp. VKM Ac-1786 TaxID=2783824 RepID=UPI00188AD10E|nr:extracellular solute-binding protein [Herbiconiux sp. VKM Ac-1786]MBF4571549.1 extracellular solute-binding protein [Herbiconiux sp. VKM Ac-1786]